jgi:hypothetical protein
LEDRAELAEIVQREQDRHGLRQELGRPAELRGERSRQRWPRKQEPLPDRRDVERVADQGMPCRQVAAWSGLAPKAKGQLGMAGRQDDAPGSLWR